MTPKIALLVAVTMTVCGCKGFFIAIGFADNNAIFRPVHQTGKNLMLSTEYGDGDYRTFSRELKEFQDQIDGLDPLSKGWDPLSPQSEALLDYRSAIVDYYESRDLWDQIRSEKYMNLVECSHLGDAQQVDPPMNCHKDVSDLWEKAGKELLEADEKLGF